jgi:hypothetical protein
MPPQDQTPPTPNSDTPNDQGSVINVTTPGDNAATGIDPMAAPSVDATPSEPTDASAGDPIAINVTTPETPAPAPDFSVPEVTAESTPDNAEPTTPPPDSFSAGNDAAPAPASDVENPLGSEASPVSAPEAPTPDVSAPVTPDSEVTPAAPAVGDAAPVPVDPTAPTPAVAPIPGATDHPKKSHKKGLLIAAIIGVVVIIALIAFVVLTSKPTNVGTTSENVTTTTQ